MPKADFIIGSDRFDDIEIVPTLVSNLYGFRHTKNGMLIRYFVLAQSTEVNHVCEVTLIKKGEEKFTPRLNFSIRHRSDSRQFGKTVLLPSEENVNVKASVDLSGCHKNYWDLISYLISLKTVDIPDDRFSLAKKGPDEIAKAIKQHGEPTIKAIIKLLTASPGLRFSEREVNELLQRKRRLAEFQAGLRDRKTEAWWQEFFDNNKWIFGYGLDYRILRIEHSQAHVGGITLSGAGQKIPDYAVSTAGNVRFMVLVEIKTAETPLLTGAIEQRNSAWKLSRELVDALTQIQACIQEWSGYGSKQPDNIEELRVKNIRTIQPKAIVVIGCLDSIKDKESKLATFELFRQSVHGVEIITFDELYERAKFIVEHTPDAS